jgi:branched-chain amino acid transport system substrate-binding protein
MTTRDRLDARLRAFLEEEAEAMPRRARSAEEMARVISPRVRRRSFVPWFLQPAAMLWPRAFRIAWTLAVLLLVLLVGAAILSGSKLLRQPPRIVQIAVDLPIGLREVDSQAIVNAVRLAVADSNGAAGAFEVGIPDGAVFDDTIAGFPDRATGSANAIRIVGEPQSIALIGPFNSSIAEAQIPITNGAGLLQCSPANTAPLLTRGADTATLRPRPDRTTYVRVVGTDDIVLRRTALYAYDELAVRSIYMIDGDDVAVGDWFVQAFLARGGTLAGRTRLPDDFNEGNAIGLMATAAESAPDAVVFTGQSAPAAWLVNQADGSGLGGTWFVARDSILEGGPTAPGSFLEIAESAADRVITAFPAPLARPEMAGFFTRFQTAYGAQPTFYAAAGYVCAQVILAALQRVDDPPNDLTAIRELVRAAVTEPEVRFDTLFGTISFDVLGDVAPDLTTVLGYDATSGGWAVRSVSSD